MISVLNSPNISDAKAPTKGKLYPLVSLMRFKLARLRGCSLLARVGAELELSAERSDRDGMHVEHVFGSEEHFQRPSLTHADPLAQLRAIFAPFCNPSERGRNDWREHGAHDDQGVLDRLAQWCVQKCFHGAILPRERMGVDSRASRVSRSTGERREGEHGACASVSRFTPDPGSGLQPARLDLQLHRLAIEPHAFAAQAHRFVQFLHWHSLRLFAQTFAPGLPIVTEKRAGDFS